MIRTLVQLQTDLDKYQPVIDEIKPFYIDPMPQAPRVEDMFDLETILSGLSIDLPREVWDMKWMAHIIEWRRDMSGYFILLTLFGG
jgi:hypothetical protein